MKIIIASILNCNRSVQRRRHTFKSLKEQGIGIDLKKSEYISKKYGQFDQNTWERHKAIVKSWGVEGRGAVWFCAIDKRQIIPSAATYNIDDISIEKADYRVPMRGGEIGCWLTHRGIWKYIETLKTPTLVLEDDAVIIPDFNKTIKSYLNEIPEDYDMFYLNHDYYIQKGNRYTKKELDTLGEPVRNFDENAIYRTLGTWRTHCYIIKPKVAEMCLNETKTANCGIDDKLARIHKDMNVYCVHPDLIGQRKQATLIRKN